MKAVLMAGIVVASLAGCAPTDSSRGVGHDTRVPPNNQYGDKRLPGFAGAPAPENAEPPPHLPPGG